MIESILIASSRKNWVTKEKRDEDFCVFCEIAKGGKKVKSKVIWKGKYAMVIMNIYPYNTGHLQVIPLRHVEKIEDLNEKEYKELCEYVRKSVKLLREVLKPHGFNIGINMGKVAGASIDHLHVHIVPRYQNDYGFMEVTAGTKVLPMSIEEVYKKLKRKVKKFFT